MRWRIDDTRVHDKQNKNFGESSASKAGRRVNLEVEADMSDHSSAGRRVLERSTDSHRHIYLYILNTAHSPLSSIFHLPLQPQHASQLFQVGHARGKPSLPISG